VWQLKPIWDGQSAVAVQTEFSDLALQFGRLPPLRTAVTQHVGVLPPQSLGTLHAIVSVGVHVSAQATA
jgi:hypothetical protein